MSKTMRVKFQNEIFQVFEFEIEFFQEFEVKFRVLCVLACEFVFEF